MWWLGSMPASRIVAMIASNRRTSLAYRRKSPMSARQAPVSAPCRKAFMLPGRAPAPLRLPLLGPTATKLFRDFARGTRASAAATTGETGCVSGFDLIHLI